MPPVYTHAASKPPDAYAACKAAVAAAHGDESMLMWGLVRSQVLEAVPAGAAFLRVCREAGVQASDFDARYRAACKAYCKAHRDVPPVAPAVVFIGRSKQSALDGLRERLERGGRGALANPFMLQTAGGSGKDKFKGCLFMAFEHWQDGLRALCVMSERGAVLHEGRLAEAVQQYEHQGVVSYFLIDWEILSTCYDDPHGVRRRTDGEIEAIARRFPMFMYKRMLDKGLLDPHEKVTFTVKNKSRDVAGAPRGGIRKTSFHFTCEVAGVPTLHHRAAGVKLFSEFRWETWHVDTIYSSILLR